MPTWLPSTAARVPVLVSSAFHLAELQILILAISYKARGIGLRSRHPVARLDHTKTATLSLGSNNIESYAVMHSGTVMWECRALLFIRYSAPLFHGQKPKVERCRGDSGLPSVCTTQCLHTNKLFDLNDLRLQAIYAVIIVASCEM